MASAKRGEFRNDGLQFEHVGVVHGAAFPVRPPIAELPDEIDVAGTLDGTSCALPSGERSTPFTDGPTVEAKTISSKGPTVRAAIYPHPDHEGNPWSQWGQGLALADGRFFSAIGDHPGKDGNSYLYEYDADTNSLRQIADAQHVVGHEAGAWGYGKIHAQIVPRLLRILLPGYDPRQVPDPPWARAWAALFERDRSALRLDTTRLDAPHPIALTGAP